MKEELISRLRWIGTLRLGLLALITLGLFEAYYIWKQSKIINSHTDHKIHPSYVFTFIAIAVVSAVLFVPYVVLDEVHPLSVFSDMSDVAFIAFSLYWGFMARNRMNTLLGAVPGAHYWFSGSWTLLFSPLYFNYKINKLYKQLPNQAL